MSLDISVYHPETEAQIELNWLRNPFGLERWARANYLYVKKEEPEVTLWDVCNQWNYEKAEQIDRPLFLHVVKQYGEVILSMDKGYFWFEVTAYIDFIEPHVHLIPRNDFGGRKRIKEAVYQGQTMGVPMQYLGNPAFGLSDKYRPDAHTLTKYQEWYQQLIDLAEMLQQPGTVFYCSN